MRRLAMAAAAAFCVGGGFVLGEFVRAVRPVGYLTRPLLAVAVLAVVIGIAASLFRQWAVVAAVFAMAWIVQPESEIALAIAAVTTGLLAYRLWKRRTPNMDGALLVAAGVFLAVGVVPVVPLMSWSTPARADVPTDGPPQYVILLDGYPRADTLAAHGFDISPFIEALEARGFTHYPEATTNHPKTFQALTAMTGGDPDNWQEGDLVLDRRIRNGWRLPDGWVTVSPPMGFVTLPHTPTLNPMGFTYFEAKLLARSAFQPGDWIMDAYRRELDRAFEAVETTDAQRVFAHFFAPHFPALYGADGSELPIPECWPVCATVDPRPPGIDTDERVGLIGGYTHWLNGRLIEVVDQILDKQPDAEIVLFSDHGGRWDDEDPEEWRRVFLASLTSGRPDVSGLLQSTP